MTAKKQPEPQGSPQGTPQDAPLVSSVDELRAQTPEPGKPKKKGSNA
jgi:hypothetical protein